MPCVCKLKVDRNQPKIKCVGCNEFFHCKCVNIKPADIEFLEKSNNQFRCKKCSTARRNSLRSPPLNNSNNEREQSLHSFDGCRSALTADEISATSPTPSNKEQSQLYLQQNPYNQQQAIHQQHQPQTSNQQLQHKDITLEHVYKEIVALRSENALALSLISGLVEEKNKLMQLVNDLRRELDVMQQEKREKCVEIVGVPNLNNNNALDCALQIFSKGICADVSEVDIDNCYVKKIKGKGDSDGDMSKLSSLSIKKLNITNNAERNLVFFNRAAKVGSESMMELVKYLARFNNYQVAKDDPAVGPNPRVLKPDAERSKAEIITDLDEESFYIEHVSFVNFTKFDLPTPIYINLVRDPVERIISWFFYVRGGYKNAILFKKNPDTKLRSPDWFKKDFNKCVLTGDSECTFEQYAVVDHSGDYRRQTLFYCGNLADCLPFNSPEAMQIAKKNVEKYYAVVGSWEDTNVTLAVLENYIPRYFQGAKLLFELHREHITNQNKNKRKPKIYEHVKDLLRKNFTNEYEFYYFCKQRLYKQYIALKLKNPS